MSEQALLFVFPHEYLTRYEEYKLRKIVRARTAESHRLDSMIGLMTRTANQLRERAAHVYQVVGKNENGTVVAISPRFGNQEGDLIVPTNVVIDMNGAWQKRRGRYEYPDFSEIAKMVSESLILVGGFHLDDCVRKFIKAAESTGKEVLLIPRLTDWYYLYCMLRLFGKECFRPPYLITLQEFEQLREAEAEKAREKLFGGISPKQQLAV